MQIERACYSHGEGVQLRGSVERRKPWQRNSGLHRLFKSPGGLRCTNSCKALEQGAIGTPSSTGHLPACSEIGYPDSRETQPVPGAERKMVPLMKHSICVRVNAQGKMRNNFLVFFAQIKKKKRNQTS